VLLGGILALVSILQDERCRISTWGGHHHTRDGNPV
jgi:hypothetical protein